MMTALAFIWAYKVGIYRNLEIESIKIKKHGRLAKSIFAYGLEWLAKTLLNSSTKNFKKLATLFLPCT